jgi:hypothetical protein
MPEKIWCRDADAVSQQMQSEIVAVAELTREERETHLRILRATYFANIRGMTSIFTMAADAVGTVTEN